MDKWGCGRGVELDFSRQANPTYSTKVERFDARLRPKCLNEHSFLSLADATATVEVWRRACVGSRKALLLLDTDSGTRST